MSVMTAWEPFPIPEEGKCGSCRYLDRSVGYLTCPIKYRCIKTGELHFERDDCDVSAFCGERKGRAGRTPAEHQDLN